MEDHQMERGPLGPGVEFLHPPRREAGRTKGDTGGPRAWRGLGGALLSLSMED